MLRSRAGNGSHPAHPAAAELGVVMSSMANDDVQKRVEQLEKTMAVAETAQTGAQATAGA